MTVVRQLVVLLSALSCFVAAPASAATVQPWPGCTGGFNSGSFDGAGRTYVPCGNPTTVGIYDATGKLVDQFQSVTHHTDVAPTWDGSLVYATGPSGPVRYRRADDGSWSLDTAWKPDPYTIWGNTTYAAAGNYLAVDRAGNLYLSHGMWIDRAPHTVVKYDPTGDVVTRFGEWNNTWALGEFYWGLAGIAVSSDGSQVYTSEVGNNRLQVWTRTGDTYTAASSFGGTATNNPTRSGECDFVGWLGRFAASYDVGLDAAGDVYVMNTTCQQVLKFNAALTAMIGNYDLRGAGALPHGFAVGPRGMVFVGENQRVVLPDGAPAVEAAPVPAPDPTPAPSPAAPPTAPSASGAPMPAGDSVAGFASQSAPTPGASTAAPDRTAPTPRLTVARHRLVGTATRRKLALAVRCTETCAVRIDILRGSQLIGRSFAAAGVRPRALRVALASRRSVGVATIRVLARDARSNRTIRSYRVFLGR